MSTSISDDVRITYDRPADVLYVSLGKPLPCYSVEDPDIEGLLLRHSFENDVLNGVTVLWFSRQDRKQLLRKIPFHLPLP